MPPLPTDLHEWLSYIDAGHPSSIDLGLERVGKVAAELRLPGRWPMPVITVAGTNGKGTTLAFMEALALADGLSVGTYSSPHLLAYNERVRIDGESVSDVRLCTAFAEVEAARERAGVSLTYFEYGTLAALWIFQHQAPNLLLLEVGLGGRLDAVNLVDAEVAVITSVDLDHQDWLGKDRESIAREKAAICRPGKPLVVGDVQPPAAIAEVCQERGASVRWRNRDFGLEWRQDGGCWWGQDNAGNAIEVDGLPYPELTAINLATALQALALSGVKLEADILRRVLPGVSLGGRCQRLCVGERQLVLDVAHNPAAVRQLLEQLSEPGLFQGVIAMLSDKDIEGTLSLLRPRLEECWLSGLGVARSAPAERLRAALGAGAAPYLVPSVAAGLAAALASPSRLPILVTGSFHTVAQALEYLSTQRVDRLTRG